jgi:hypothetical protein
MEVADFKKGGSVNNMYRDIFLLHKKYAMRMPLEDDGWSECINDYNVISEKYNHSPLLSALLVAVLNELDRETVLTRSKTHA